MNRGKGKLMGRRRDCDRSGSRLLSACWPWRLARRRPRAPAPATSSPRSTRPTRRSDGWQAGTCSKTPRPARVDTPEPVLRTGRRAPAGRLHPVHRQARTARPAKSPGRRTEDRPRRPARRASASTRRRRRSATSGRLRSRRPACPAARRSATSVVTAALPPLAIAAPAVRSRRLQPRAAARANRRASASTSPATTSSSKPTSPGTATTTRASRSTSPVPNLGPLTRRR